MNLFDFAPKLIGREFYSRKTLDEIDAKNHRSKINRLLGIFTHYYNQQYANGVAYTFCGIVIIKRTFKNDVPSRTKVTKVEEPSGETMGNEDAASVLRQK